MPRVTVTVPHDQPVEAVVEKVKPALEKTAADFDGKDLNVEWKDDHAEFSFKSLGFTIKGEATVDDDQVTVHVDLPFAAMMYKEKAKKGIEKNVTRALEE